MQKPTIHNLSACLQIPASIMREAANLEQKAEKGNYRSSRQLNRNTVRGWRMPMDRDGCRASANDSRDVTRARRHWYEFEVVIVRALLASSE
jgi:hypothetical protein